MQQHHPEAQAQVASISHSILSLPHPSIPSRPLPGPSTPQWLNAHRSPTQVLSSLLPKTPPQKSGQLLFSLTLDGIPATALFDTRSKPLVYKERIGKSLTIFLLHLMPIYILVRFFTGRQDPIESLLCVRQVYLIGAPIS